MPEKRGGERGAPGVTDRIGVKTRVVCRPPARPQGMLGSREVFVCRAYEVGDSIVDMEVDGGALEAAPKAKFSVERAVEFMSGGRKVARYFMAGRQAFANPQFVSLAVDASRVSRKKVLIGVLAMPNNVAMWAAPQVNA